MPTSNNASSTERGALQDVQQRREIDHAVIPNSTVFAPHPFVKRIRIRQVSGETIRGWSKYTCPDALKEQALKAPETEARGGRPVMYTNLHMTGGTAMCSLARVPRNSEKMRDAQKGPHNCNLGPDRFVAEQHSAVSCAERMDFCGPYFNGRLMWRNLTWMSQERWVDRELCSALYYVVTLRDPLDRMVANVSMTSPPPLLPNAQGIARR